MAILVARHWKSVMKLGDVARISATLVRKNSWFRAGNATSRNAKIARMSGNVTDARSSIVRIAANCVMDLSRHPRRSTYVTHVSSLPKLEKATTEKVRYTRVPTKVHQEKGRR